MTQHKHLTLISKVPVCAQGDDVQIKDIQQNTIVSSLDWMVLLPRMKQYGVIFPIGGVDDDGVDGGAGGGADGGAGGGGRN